MRTIYVPKGRAFEYSPLALNIYSGCDHGCQYCYCLNWDQNWHKKPVKPKDDILVKAEKDARRIRGSKDQVLISFAGDPYCQAEDRFDITPKVLGILLDQRIPIALLTKGGHRTLRNRHTIRAFGDHIKVGATLTFDNEAESKKFEPGAAVPQDRIETLKTLASLGVKTWASLEPVICTDQVLALIERTHHFVDHYMIGVLNYFSQGNQRAKDFREVILTLRKHGSQFYIKEDLQLRIIKEGKIDLRPEETDRTLYDVTPFPEEQVGLEV
jgi:DNA repair photolyase